MAIKLRLVTKHRDHYCNFCHRLRDEELKDVDVYELLNDERSGMVVQICEFCARELQPQLKGIDD